MLWLPAVSVDTVTDAVPLLRVACPSSDVPSRKITPPVGVPELDVVVAVKTTFAPCTAGFGEALTTVVVATLGGGVGPVPELPPPPQPAKTHMTGRRKDAKAIERKVMRSPP